MRAAAVTAGRPGPSPVPPGRAGADQLGGWIARDGKFYPSPKYHHNMVAYELRASGNGPCEPWTMRDGWVKVNADGDVLALPGQLTQPQWDTLGDMLQAAPESGYRSQMLHSLRQLRDLELLR